MAKKHCAQYLFLKCEVKKPLDSKSVVNGGGSINEMKILREIKYNRIDFKNSTIGSEKLDDLPCNGSLQFTNNSSQKIIWNNIFSPVLVPIYSFLV